MTHTDISEATILKLEIDLHYKSVVSVECLSSSFYAHYEQIKEKSNGDIQPLTSESTI